MCEVQEHSDRDYRVLILSNGMEVKVSPEDYGWASQNLWSFNGTRSPYAVRSVRIGGGKQRKQYLHRLVCVAPQGMVVNHVNGDTLDCRRENLHPVRPRSNKSTLRVNRGLSGKTGVTVVYASDGTRRYRARIGHDKGIESIGTYESLDEAARAYDRRAVQLMGLYADTNFPLSDYMCPGIERWAFPDMADADALRQHLSNAPF